MSQHDQQKQVKKVNDVLEFTFQSRWNQDCLASSLFSNNLLQYVVENTLQYVVENTLYIGGQVGTNVILDRLPSKFMKVQMRMQELCHV